ncbi:MAG: nitroreductase family protein, partial [Neisseriaceae bacterium]|nr:nitroreductase family protein [Neisseriaceae bacterium]
FETFSNHSSGMAQLAVWTALAKEKIGASLQHYNPIIDDEVKDYWDIPEKWELVAQMPFGSIESPAGEKSIISRENRFLVKNK